MGKKDWQRALEDDDLSAVVATNHRGRGWRVFSVILVLAAATFAAAYYVPLYRAHAVLTEQYRKLSLESKTQRQQLTDTIATLKQVAEERDRLAGQARSEKSDQDGDRLRCERLEGNLGVALKKFLGKGRVELARDGVKLKLKLATPALLGQGTADVTEFGKKALCALAGSVKSSGSTLRVAGSGSDAKTKQAVSFPLAAARAANVAKHLSEGCGLEAARIQIEVDHLSTDSTLGATIHIAMTK